MKHLTSTAICRAIVITYMAAIIAILAFSCTSQKGLQDNYQFKHCTKHNRVNH